MFLTQRGWVCRGTRSPCSPRAPGRAGRWGTLLPPAAAPLHGEKVGPLGAARVQERLLDCRVHGTQGINGTNYFFSVFISGFQKDVACGQTSAIWAQPCPENIRFDCSRPETRSGVGRSVQRSLGCFLLARNSATRLRCGAGGDALPAPFLQRTCSALRQLCSTDAALGFQRLERVDFSKFAG